MAPPTLAAAALAAMVGPVVSTARMWRGECIPAPSADSTMAGLPEAMRFKDDPALAASTEEEALTRRRPEIGTQQTINA